MSGTDDGVERRSVFQITNNTSARCVFKNNLRCVILRVEAKMSMSSLKIMPFVQCLWLEVFVEKRVLSHLKNA